VSSDGPVVRTGAFQDGRDRTKANYDVVVAGAGVIGLSIAWKAAMSGFAVALVDPEPGHGASWAAAGMLAPVSELHFGEEDLLALNIASARRWPSFASELESYTGRSVGYLTSGTLLVAIDQGDRAIAQRMFDFQRELGLGVEWLNARRARELEPNLSPAVRGGLLADADNQVDNRLLISALMEATRRSGCRFHSARVKAVETTGGAVSGALLDTGDFLGASAMVLASGAWSAELTGVPETSLPPVRPVKGQILRLRTPPHGPLIGRAVCGIVNGEEIYLVPRLDGTVVVGATVEEKGFDTTVTAGATYELLRDAHRVVPGVSELELVEASANLRPGSPDNAPILGPSQPDGPRGFIVATGHYRNGILLAPITAEYVTALLKGSEPPLEVMPFSPARFQVPSLTGDRRNGRTRDGD
jgi:glycine oxidase